MLKLAANLSPERKRKFLLNFGKNLKYTEERRPQETRPQETMPQQAAPPVPLNRELLEKSMIAGMQTVGRQRTIELMEEKFNCTLLIELKRRHSSDSESEPKSDSVSESESEPTGDQENSEKAVEEKGKETAEKDVEEKGKETAEKAVEETEKAVEETGLNRYPVYYCRVCFNNYAKCKACYDKACLVGSRSKRHRLATGVCDHGDLSKFSATEDNRYVTSKYLHDNPQNANTCGDCKVNLASHYDPLIIRTATA